MRKCATTLLLYYICSITYAIPSLRLYVEVHTVWQHLTVSCTGKVHMTRVAAHLRGLLSALRRKMTHDMSANEPQLRVRVHSKAIVKIL